MHEIQPRNVKSDDQREIGDEKSLLHDAGAHQRFGEPSKRRVILKGLRGEPVAIEVLRKCTVKRIEQINRVVAPAKLIAVNAKRHDDADAQGKERGKRIRPGPGQHTRVKVRILEFRNNAHVAANCAKKRPFVTTPAAKNPLLRKKNSVA